MADTPQPTSSAAPLPAVKQTRNLDGIYVFVGVGGGATRLAGEWDSTIGGQIALASVSEARRVSLAALDIGLGQYGERSGGRAWLGPAIGLDLGALVGLSANLTIEWDRVRPPKVGAVATLWCFAGIVPYASVGRHQDSETFVEVGIRIALPALRFGRRGLL